MFGDQKKTFWTRSLQIIEFAVFFLCASLPHTAKAQDITTGLIGYWNFDETTGTTASNLIGSASDGTVTGTDFDTSGVPGKFGNALQFDGMDDMVNLGSTLGITNDFTICAWVKPTSNTTGYIFGKTDLGTNNGPFVRQFSSGNEWYMGMSNSNNLPSPTVEQNVWQHLCAVYRPTPDTSKFYKNATVINSRADFAAYIPNNVQATIGNREDNARDFEGVIDEVRIYNRALTDDDVTKLYNYTPYLPPCNTDADSDGEPDYEAVMLYNNDEKVMQYCNGTEWISVGSTPDGMPTGCSNIGQTCDDNTIYAGNSPDGDVPMYTPPADQSTGAYWGMMNFTTGLSSYEAGEKNTADAYVHVQNADGDFNPDDGNTPNAFVICAELEAYGYDDWYLPALNELDVLYTYKDTGDLNGTFIDTGGNDSYYWSSTERNTGTSDYARGIRFNTDYMFYDDKSAVYNVRCVRKPVKSTSCTSPEAEPGTMFFNRAEGVLQYCNGENWINMGPKTATGGVNVDDALSPAAPAGSLIGYWPLDADATDSAGSNDGSLVGGSSIVTGGKFAGALDLDGTNGQVDFGDPAGGDLDFGTANSFTLSAWIKPDVVSGLSRIFSKGHWAWNNGGYAVWLYDGQIEAGLTGVDQSSSVAVLTSSAVIDVNVWSHVVITFDQTAKTISIIVNGEAQSLTKFGGTCGTVSGTELDYSACTQVTASSAYDFRLGSHHNNGEYYDGQMDDVRIYSSALSEEEVAALYKSNSLAGHWKLDETEGTDAADSSGNGFDGTMTGDLDADTDSVPGIVGKALRFEGTNITGITADTQDNMPNFTACTWFYLDSLTNTDGDAFFYLFSKGGWAVSIADIATTPKLDFRISTTNSYPRINSATTIAPQEWYHMCAVHKGINVVPDLYLNGIEDESGGTTGTGSQLDDSSNSLTLGVGTNEYYSNIPGILDDVRIYNRALSADEIENLYFATGGDDSIAISGCPNIGDECDDGSFYIGDSPADGKKVYMTSVTHETTSRWDEDPPCYRCGLDDTGATSINDGQTNVEALRAYDGDNATAGNLDGFAAVKYCDNLTDAHGHDDWYLPAGGFSSSSELNLIWEMIDALGSVGGISTANWYWSSSEEDSILAVGQFFGSGLQGSLNKETSTRVRCVRRGDKQLDTATCSNPDGVGGQMFYNNDEDIMQYCNGEEWVGITGTVPGTIPVPDTTDPVWTTAAGTVDTIEPSTALSVTVTATDDSGTVTYSKTGGAGWISVNATTGELTGTAPGSATTDSITVTATDPSANTASRSFDVVVEAAADPCTTGAIGTMCTSDNAIYAGTTVGGVRLYAARCDYGMSWDGSTCTGTRTGRQWKTTNTATAGTGSLTDGVINTDAIATAGIADHPAAEACRNLGAQWYLPAKDELEELYTNLADTGVTPGDSFSFDISGSYPSGYYWSSSEDVSTTVWTLDLSGGPQFSFNRPNNFSVRCVRR